MSTKPYHILEVANTHGGSFDYVLDLINEFSSYMGDGLKFQPLHPDMLATPDYQWHSVYKELYFSPDQWHTILHLASETKEVWLDLFDSYGCQIYQQESDLVSGIKLQSSVLFNLGLINDLEKVGLEGKILAINVSGFDIPTIAERVEDFAKRLCPKEIWLEVGFQSYPTALAESGLVKIQELKKHFDNPLVFADHADAEGEDAIWLPIFAAMEGVQAIEKHIRHSSLETKYDHFSSLKPEKYAQFRVTLDNYLDLKDRPFINAKETAYLQNSVQIPIAKKLIQKGKQIDLTEDLEFKRSGKSGMDILTVKKRQQDFHILAVDVQKGEPLKQEYFKRATIATIVACRLKSSRLPKKALLPIGKLTSVEKCLKSCLNFKNINHTILATSTHPDDQELENYRFNEQVIFHRGHPDDVIQRYLDIIDTLKIDVIIRVTADMPYVSADIAEFLLNQHFKSGADYTAAKDFAVGTAPEIINVQALKKVKEHFPSADYSEYMTWYFQNNREFFNVKVVDLPKDYIRDYRLTLDYQEDLDLFNALQTHLDKENKDGSLFQIFDFLDDNPKVVELNNHIGLKYKTDQNLIDTLNKVTKIKA